MKKLLQVVSISSLLTLCPLAIYAEGTAPAAKPNAAKTAQPAAKPGVPVVKPKPKKDEREPRIRRTLNFLNKAGEILKKENQDLGEHRANALKHIAEAEAEMEKALDYIKAHPMKVEEKPAKKATDAAKSTDANKPADADKGKK